VYGLALGSSNLYVAGSGAGGHIASYTFAGARRWFRVLDGAAASTIVAGKQVVFGGHFNNVCSGNTGGGSPFQCTTPIARQHLLATTPGGALTAWAPNVNSRLGVFTVRATRTRVWAGGDFTSVGPFSRRHVTRFSYK
jgi:hypothetical protein